MPQFRCPGCQQVYGEAGYCPYDGQRLTLAPETVSAPPTAVSAVDNEEGILHQYTTGDAPQGYDRLIGQVLDGRYVIERKIGEGGMGVVFAARHMVIERPLAIKVLKREVARDSSTIKRFVQEARAASKIGHPSIVDVTDFGTTPDGLTYQVMEYVDGTTLSATIKMSAPLPAERALPIAAQIAQALGAAHDKGIVHRDLKPENVFLINRDGRRDFVKIVDFGIAKVTPLDQDGKVEGPRLTRAGAVFGTPEYMAPEQAAGRSDTDARVDVYALGTILYEMLTGKVPHKSESMVRTLAMQMLDPIIPPSKLRPDLTFDPDLEAVVMKALAKKREQRYATMNDFLAAMREVAKGVELSQPVSSSVNAVAPSPLALQAHPPGVVAPSELATWRPGAPPPVFDTRPARDSAPPRTADHDAPIAVGPVSAAGDTATGEVGGHLTRRQLNEPAFVTSPPRMTFELTEPPPPPPPRKKWPLLVAAVLGVGAAGAGIALLLRHVERAPIVDADALTVVEQDVDGGLRVPPGPPIDGAAIIILPVADAGEPLDGGHRIVREETDARPSVPRDAGDLLVVRTVDGGAPGLTPEQRGVVSIEIETHPNGGILMIGHTYRGPDGTHLEEPRGSKVRVTCTLPGYEAGHVDLVFNGQTEFAVCTMKRIVHCIPGVKNPFDDCPDVGPVTTPGGGGGGGSSAPGPVTTPTP
ncbi:MAG TPA: serine/threonine-protein kinase [Kofleriaceae bacterium]|nr:serine/threonine-protein kinase [Kofleriaceae bacterium]